MQVSEFKDQTYHGWVQSTSDSTFLVWEENKVRLTLFLFWSFNVQVQVAALTDSAVSPLEQTYGFKTFDATHSLAGKD